MGMEMNGGVWPTMITPFTDDNRIDYDGLGKLVDWYVERGVHGLFAVCQSSEMFHLTLEERVSLASFVKEAAAGRVPVIASGHISDAFEDQVKELNAMAGTGIDALVLITNRLASQEESDDVWIERLERLLTELPEDVTLGLYECPYPYKRLLTPKTIKWCADQERFRFLKDTSCDIDAIRAKLEAVNGSGLRIYNANSATLLETLKIGAVGYSGVMANFHPELYVRLVENWRERGEEAGSLSDFLSLSSLIEKQLYPANAKYYLMLEGILSHGSCRTQQGRTLTATNRLEVEQLRRLCGAYAERFKGLQ
ncbi:dihydrodipicolinate synthase family protein [Paenibacillus lycopersici]|uniref:Dihydrodipicolinate synthase family protein n=1 Tax=Paenibacillus lycopersici TaxID=2704462 RepID=A0A6C0G5R7_9BACL|nr:dihydrodipicolinate synthase family protein [Paenibacillus lycopersici]QHT63024.1 dihydrodipicolinate synthase family protein [Paenibacillus lycopersici]